MEIGISVAVFLVLSLLLLALFCFLTKYFHHKLEQTLEETAEIYSMVDQLSVHSQEDQEPGEDKARTKGKSKTGKKRRLDDNEEMYVQMSDLRQPMYQKDNIYVPSILKQKLNQGYNQDINTNRSLASSKWQTPDKINTIRSNASNDEQGQPRVRLRPDKINTNRTNQSRKSKQHQERSSSPKSPTKSLARSSAKSSFKEEEDENLNVTKHTCINKLVCYDDQGIFIAEFQLKSIKRLNDGTIKECKKLKTEFVSPSSEDFQEQLEIYGFEENIFTCHKYETHLEVEDMRFNEDYSLKNLKSSETKESIEIEEFIRLNIEMKVRKN